MEEPSTILEYLRRNYQKWGDRVAVRHKNFGLWKEYTWKHYYETVKLISLGLISLGLKAGDEVAIIGDAEPEWFWAEIAVHSIRCVPIGLYTDAQPPEIKYLLKHFHCEIIFSHDQEQVDKVLLIKDDLPLLRKAIYWDTKGLRNYDDELIMDWEELKKIGQKYEIDNPRCFEENIKTIKEDDIAYVAPTSGTTGTYSKGAIHTHKNLIVCYKALAEVAPLDYNDRYLGFLPPTVIFEQLMVICAGIIDGVVAHFPEEPETVKEDMRDISPTAMLYAGTIWDALASEVQAKISETNMITRFLYCLCKEIGYKRETKKGNTLSKWLWEASYKLADIVLLRHLRDNIGMLYVRHPFSSATMLSPESVKFFRSIGIKVRDAYGSMEMNIVCAQPSDNIKYGTVGMPLRKVQIKIQDDEMLVRSPFIFRGYYNDPVKTNNVLRDGWYHTGDAGYVDEDGYVVYIDRFSDLAELSTGEKYSPMFIESKLRFSPAIKTSMAVGQSHECLAVIINLDFEFVSRWAEQNRINYTTFADLSQKDEVATLVRKEIVKINKLLPEHSRVMKFILLHKEFDPDEAELTRTFKVRRKFVSERYKDLIEAFYDGSEGLDMVSEVRYRDGRHALSNTYVKIRDVY